MAEAKETAAATAALATAEEDKSEWRARALRHHSDVLELRERARTIARPADPLPSFGRDHRRAARTEAAGVLPPEAVMQLVLHYLHETGLTETRDALLREAEALMPELNDALRGGPAGGVPEYSEATGDPQLRHALAPLLRLGLKDATGALLVAAPLAAAAGAGAGAAGEQEDPEVEAAELFVAQMLEAAGAEDEEEGAKGAGADGEAEAQADAAAEQKEQQLKDVPVLEEETRDGTNCLFRSSHTTASAREIVAGTLNQLVRWLAGASPPGEAFTGAFFLAYPAFASPERLMGKLVQLHAGANSASGVRGAVLRALASWAKRQPLDFDESLHEQAARLAKAATDEAAAAGAEEDEYAVTLAAALGQLDEARSRALREASEEEPSRPAGMPEPARPQVPALIFSPRLTIDNIDVEEIANQLCLRDMRMFRRIRPRELLACAWRRGGAAAAPNVVAMMRRFDELSRWAVKCVLDGRFVEGAPVDRKAAFTRLTRITERLLLLNNFHSLLALFSALSCGAVGRALASSGMPPDVWAFDAKPGGGTRRGTIDMSLTSPLNNLAMLFNPEGNYSEYRKRLRSITRSGVAALPIHLRDFTAMHEAIPDTVLGMINWHKHACWAKAVQEFLRPAETVFYNLQNVEQIQALLRDFAALPDEAALLERALVIQQEGASVQ